MLMLSCKSWTAGGKWNRYKNVILKCCMYSTCSQSGWTQCAMARKTATLAREPTVNLRTREQRALMRVLKLKPCLSQTSQWLAWRENS